MITGTHEIARHMPGPRPQHKEAAADEAETLGGRFESSIMHTGVVVASQNRSNQESAWFWPSV